MDTTTQAQVPHKSVMYPRAGARGTDTTCPHHHAPARPHHIISTGPYRMGIVTSISARSSRRAAIRSVACAAAMLLWSDKTNPGLKKRGGTKPSDRSNRTPSALTWPSAKYSIATNSAPRSRVRPCRRVSTITISAQQTSAPPNARGQQYKSVTNKTSCARCGTFGADVNGKQRTERGGERNSERGGGRTRGTKNKDRDGDLEAARRRPVLAAIGTRVKPERNQDDPKGQKEQRAHRPNESHLPNPFCKAGTGNKQPCWDGQGEGDALEIKVTKRNKKKGVYASARTFGAVPWGGEGLFNGPQVRWVAAGRGTGAEEERPAGKLRLDLIRPLVRPLPNSRVVGGSIMDIIIIQTKNNSPVTEKKKVHYRTSKSTCCKGTTGGQGVPPPWRQCGGRWQQSVPQPPDRGQLRQRDPDRKGRPGPPPIHPRQCRRRRSRRAETMRSTATANMTLFRANNEWRRWRKN